MNITISIKKGDKVCHQIHNCIIPTIGSRFSYYGTRDSDGNYYEDGKPRLDIEGIVESIEYTYEQRGKGSGTYSSTMYVDITLV